MSSSKTLPIKTNNGKIPDIPEFSVNRFAVEINRTSNILDAKSFFLTHCDKDILDNIFMPGVLQSLADSEKDTKCLYMHQLSYNFLLYWTTTIFVTPREEESKTLLQQLLATNKIRLLEINTPIKIEAKSSWVTVTALSAGHQAGSIMLLFEKSSTIDESDVNFRMLHTGSCRVNVNDLRNMAPLHDSVSGKPKKINKLYLDTSYCTSNITELPSRRVVTEQLLKLTKEKIMIDPECRFEVVDEIFSTRYPVASCTHFFRCVFETSKERIHMPVSLATFVRSIPNFPDIATTDADSGEENRISHYHASCGQINDNEFCSEHAEDWATFYEVTEIILQSHFSGRGGEEALEIFKDERNWRDFGYQKTINEIGCNIHVIYCHNLSRFEQARLVKYLNIDPNEIYPLFSSFGTTIKEMKRLLQEALDTVSAAEEPIEIAKDYPSHFYDCTGATWFKYKSGSDDDQQSFVIHKPESLLLAV